MGTEQIANEFLEVSSEQRLGIILILNREKTNLTSMAKQLDATAAEVHRNIGRLQKIGMIKKDSDGSYELTMYGKTIYSQIPTLSFMVKNKKYFETHTLTDIPFKYVQRLGALAESDLISGYVKVQEKWESIYKNAEKYINNILIEIPYNEEILKILQDKLKHKVTILSIFSESAIISNERQDLLDKIDFSRFVREGNLQRKMRKDVKIAMIINEKEAGVCLPTNNDDPDMSKMFYGSDILFHEWCFDFFNDYWKNSNAFQESKISK